MVELSRVSNSVFRAGPYFWPGVVTTLGPGALVLTEFLIVLASPDSKTGLPTLHPYVTFLSDAGPVGAVLLALLGLASAYSLGFLLKALMFRMLRRPPETTHIDFWGNEIEVLRASLGAESVDRVLKGNNLSVLLGERRASEDLAEVNWHVFVYCKLWLRSREPVLNVDTLEAEINLLLGLIPPIAFLWFVLARFVVAAHPLRSVGELVLWIAWLLIWFFMLRAMSARVGSLRRAERKDALRNFVIANIYEDAERSSPDKDALG